MLKPVLGSQIQLGHPLARGLVGCWLFNEGAGGKYHSIAGRDVTFEHSGVSVVPWTGGKFGYALDCVPGNSPNLKPSPQKSLLSTTPGTILTWCVNRDTSNDHWLIHMAANIGASAHYFALGLNNSLGKAYGLCKNAINTQFVESTTTMNAVDWYQVVYTAHQVNPMKMYINGKYENQNVAARIPLNMDEMELLSLTRASLYLDGLVDHIMIWNRALSDQEIAQLYINPFGMFEEEIITPPAPSELSVLDYERKTRGVARGVCRGAA